MKNEDSFNCQFLCQTSSASTMMGVHPKALLYVTFAKLYAKLKKGYKMNEGNVSNKSYPSL